MCARACVYNVRYLVMGYVVVSGEGLSVVRWLVGEMAEEGLMLMVLGLILWSWVIDFGFWLTWC